MPNQLTMRPPVGTGGGSHERAFYPELESLRGLAALSVSLCHVFNAASPHKVPIQDYSFHDWAHLVLTSLFSSEGGVAIFFVLSGYVLSSGLDLDNKLTLRVYAAFAIRRVFRIMPAAWVSVAFAVIVLRTFFGVPTIAHQLKVEFALVGPFVINPPLWTLSVEMAICTVFPFLVATNASLGTPIRLAIFVALLWISRSPWLPSFAMYLFMFQAGVMVPVAAVAITRLRIVAAPLFVVALGAVMGAVNLCWHGMISTPTEVALEGLGAFYVVAYAHGERSPLRALLHHPICRFIGRVSYSMYLFNYAVAQVFFHLVSDRLLHGGFLAPFNLWSQLVVAAIAIPANIAVAWLGWRFIEEPFHRWGRVIARHVLGSDRFAGSTAAPMAAPALGQSSVGPT
jgi:peptidoglycan/LPS O-acetylase OafA/YrhL